MSCELPSGVRALGTPISNHSLCSSFPLSTLPRGVNGMASTLCMDVTPAHDHLKRPVKTRIFTATYYDSYYPHITQQQRLYAYTHTSSIIIRITLERHFSSIYTWANNFPDWRLGERTELFGLGELVGWVVSCISLLYIILHWRDRDTQNLEHGHRANVYLGTGKGGGNTPLQSERGTRALIARYQRGTCLVSPCWHSAGEGENIENS